MKNIILIGGGGNALVILSTVADINNKNKDFKITGFLDDKKKKLKNIKYLGKINLKNIQSAIKKKNTYFIWTLRSVTLGNQSVKNLLKLKIPQKNFATIIHPTANVSVMSKIGNGVTIHPFVNIGPNVKIGNHVHIFAQSMIGHDTKLEDYCYISNNVSIGSRIEAKEGVYFGSNSTIIEKVKIFSWSIIGMGSVLLKNVNSKKIMVGNPARELKNK